MNVKDLPPKMPLSDHKNTKHVTTLGAHKILIKYKIHTKYRKALKCYHV